VCVDRNSIQLTFNDNCGLHDVLMCRIKYGRGFVFNCEDGMRSKRLLILIASVVLLVTVLALQTLGVTGLGRRIEFETLGKGSFSEHEDSRYYVVNNVDEWTDMWNQHERSFFPQSSLPDVDFSKSTIIAVFQGVCPNTGYGIEIKEVIDTGLSVVVKVEKTYPGKGCITGQMVTYPYHIVVMDKIEKHILFDTTSLPTLCG
jgi:hypothetical protein